MITFSVDGSTKNTEAFLKKMMSSDLYSELDSFARRGVSALQAATPVETGLTAASWGYEIVSDGKKTQIVWTNTHREGGGPPVAILLQYGHGTGTGGYVAGRDYINPAIQPIFDEIAQGVWEKVTHA